MYVYICMYMCEYVYICVCVCDLQHAVTKTTVASCFRNFLIVKFNYISAAHLPIFASSVETNGLECHRHGREVGKYR